MTDQAPVHQILRMQEGKPGYTVEARSNKVVVLSHPDDIRIRVIGKKHRIAVGAVALVGNPGRSQDAARNCGRRFCRREAHLRLQ